MTNIPEEGKTYTVVSGDDMVVGPLTKEDAIRTATKFFNTFLQFKGREVEVHVYHEDGSEVKWRENA